MERKRSTSSLSAQSEQPKTDAIEVMSIVQIQSLVRLLDRSDVSELEVKSAEDGVHLVLRKLQVGSLQAAGAGEPLYALADVETAAESATHSTNQHKIVSSLVGVFHPWLKPRSGILVSVGDVVKVGQLVGTIESLNVLNEIETPVAGRVSEIHVQDGQPVEYGQVLVTIEQSDEAEGS